MVCCLPTPEVLYYHILQPHHSSHSELLARLEVNRESNLPISRKASMETAVNLFGAIFYII